MDKTICEKSQRAGLDNGRPKLANMKTADKMREQTMARIEWHQAVKVMAKNMVKISTRGDGYGSGILVPPPANAPGNYCILTAYHVVRTADQTGATIDILIEDTNRIIKLPSLQRSIFFIEKRDQALILFSSSKTFGSINSYKLPEGPGHYSRGVEFGWLGWPRIARDTLCFFRGVVSAYVEQDDAYLVDGASIHGISGGPVFCCQEDNTISLAGIVTEYHPNQVVTDNGKTSQAWPGLAMFRTVNPLLELYESETKKTPSKLPPVSAPTRPPKNEDGGNVQGVVV